MLRVAASDHRRKPGPGARINPMHPLARGLQRCWLLGPGPKSFDLARFVDTAVSQDNGASTTAKFKTTPMGLGFNCDPTGGGGGPSQNFYIPTVGYAVNGPTTFEVWTRTDGVAGSGTNPRLMTDVSSVAGVFGPNSTQPAGFMFYDGTTLNFATTVPANGTLNHYVVTWTGAATTCTHYLNGKPDGTFTGSTATWTINRLSVADHDFWSGAYVSARIWNRILRPDEVLALYNDPWGMFRPYAIAVPPPPVAFQGGMSWLSADMRRRP